MNKAIDFFKTFLKNEQLLLDEPLKKHTTFKIGGNASILILPHNIEEIKKTILYCKTNNINYYIIGNGSNLLVSDYGYKGVIIKLFKNFSKILLKENMLIAQAGATLPSISNIALKHSLKGFEFAAGIPGTIGGGACMNAGAYGYELKDIVESVTVLKDDEILVFDNKECGFKYRNSNIQTQNLIVLEVCIKLEKGIKEEIQNNIKNYNNMRKEKQPLKYPSAGSTFKRPVNNFAGKLIMEAGLAGKNVGDAFVSEKHCGFIVNKGNASCSDVLKLIDIVCKEVYEKFNVCLEKEIKVIGEKI